VILGIISRMLKTRMKWKSKYAINVSIAHKLVAYFIIFMGYLAIAFGIYAFRTNDDNDFPLEYIHLTVTFLVWTVLEI
jgi:hypothetical protein